MSYIDNTFVGWASTARAGGASSPQAALERVSGHYASLCAAPLERGWEGDARSGMAMLYSPREEMRWPVWSQGPELTVASTNAIAGWRRITRSSPEQAPIKLGKKLRKDPAAAGKLNPPFVIAIRDSVSRKMTIVNDALGGARLYELKTAEITVWSNRIGAAVLFAGTLPEADEEAWALFAASGWFPGATTPYRGVKKVSPGSVIEVAPNGDGVRVGGGSLGLLEPIVAPREPPRFRWAHNAVSQLRDTAQDISDIWKIEPTMNLSGGRDSRVVAAAMLAVGSPATFRTMDIAPGEADVARRLLALAPGSMQHLVTQPERSEPEDDLRERIGNSHLVHDGVANPMSCVQAAVILPQEESEEPLIGGHGGEIGHGFYYSRDGLNQMRKGKPGLQPLVDRLDKSRATDEATELSRVAIRSTLEEGRSYGLKGATLLDFYYLRERLPYRAGLGNRNDRYAPCVAPAYLRACFDLTPRQRTRAKLHRSVVAALMPAWREVDFFHGSGPLNRARIWERGSHTDEMAEMLEDSSAWESMFKPRRVRNMWVRVHEDRGRDNFEHVFMRVAWRVCFDEHLSRLAGRIAEPVAQPVA